jgi:hypothetical protein
VLAAPLDRQIAQASHANTAREPSLSCGLDEARGQEGESNRPINLPDAAPLTLGNVLDVRNSRDELIQPQPRLCDRADEVLAPRAESRPGLLPGAPCV